MLTRDIPGDGLHTYGHLVLDYNGTIAEGGIPCEGLRELIDQLSRYLSITVMTADTYGSVMKALDGWPLCVKVIEGGRQIEAKGQFVRQLKQSGSEVIAMGNGQNDEQMLSEADLAIAVLGSEGLCARILAGTDVLVRSAVEGLELVLNENALSATLKS